MSHTRVTAAALLERKLKRIGESLQRQAGTAPAPRANGGAVAARIARRLAEAEARGREAS